MCVRVQLCHLSVAPWTVGRQAPLPRELSRQDYWSRLPFPTLGALPNPGIEFTPLLSFALASGSFTTCATWENCFCLKTAYLIHIDIYWLFINVRHFILYIYIYICYSLTFNSIFLVSGWGLSNTHVFLHKACHTFLAFGHAGRHFGTILGSHFKQQNYQHRNTNYFKSGTKQISKGWFFTAWLLK